MKVCAACRIDKPLDQFSKKSAAHDGKQPWCKECNRIRSRRYYAENKPKHRAVIKLQKQKQVKRNRAFIVDYLNSHPCVDCGLSDIRVLEFDHTGEIQKLYNVADLIRNSYSLDKIVLEISKCEVRCCNCHRIKTSARGNHWRNNIPL